MTNRLFGLLLFAILLVSAPSALAVDGVILINQNTSVNGIPGCPHAGFPIVICQSGSYRLTGNLVNTDPNTTVINITADDVSLDLNGFAISGPVTCNTFQICSTATGAGISSLNNSNITVKNGTVRGTSIGIALNGSAPSGKGLGQLIQEMHVSGNAGAGIFIVGGIVTHCVVTLNGGQGITIFGSGIASFNSINHNAGDGIDLADTGMASHNEVSFNGGNGIGGNGLAVNNTIMKNTGYGVAINAIRGNVIDLNNTGCFLFYNTSLGENSCNGFKF